ncbi:VOC family protein [Agromyces silvae]|uniref:VOC family protein n=1 Tax=Agromyces silvae TaxID=3388266 RepID=UPI00280A5EE1|nr:VOC family protein [Agromyces protaetiae]
MTLRESRPPLSEARTDPALPNGFTSVTPFITVARARDAIEFYRHVFGVRVVDVTEVDGKVVHAELEFPSGRLQLGEPNDVYGLVAAGTDGDCYSLGHYCADVDAVAARAVAAGAAIREPITDFVTGDRYCSLRDPFGVRWSVMTRIEEIPEAEGARRVAEWAHTQQATT